MAADLSKIESAVSTIQNNSSNIDQALSGGKLDSIITALQNLDRGISSSSKLTKGNKMPTNFSAMTSMLKVVNSINPKLETFSLNISSINRGLKSLSATLDNFKSNFSNYKPAPHSTSKTTSSGAKNSLSNKGGGFESVKEILTDIYAEISEFRKDFLAISGRTGNVKIDKQLAKIRKEEAQEYIKEKKAEKVLKDKESSAAERRKARRELREIQKGRQKVEDAKAGKRTPNAWEKIASLPLDVGTKLLQGDIKTSDVLNKGVQTLTQISPLAGAIAGLVKAGLDAVAKIQEVGSNFARSQGGGKAGMEQFINQARIFNKNAPIKMGYTFDEFGKVATDLSDATGRQAIRRTQRDMESAIDLKRFGLGGDIINEFDTFGKSIQGTQDYFSKVYGRAGKTGLSFKKLTDGIKNNLKLAQKYSFSKGVDGLAKMVEQSTRLKFNMSETAKFAEKVSTVEGAMKTAASLSVLGGDFRQLADPMNLLYMSLNDMEGLQETLINNFKSKAFWDKDKGQFDINAQDRQLMKIASEAMGVDYGEMTNIAFNSAREDRIRKQAGAKYGSYMDYIVNLAQLDKNGRAYISDTTNATGKGENSRVYLDSEDFEKILSTLKSESEAKDMKENSTLGDVFQQTKSIYDLLDDYLKGITAKLGAIVARFVSGKQMTTAREAFFKDITSKNASEEDKKLYNSLLKEYGTRNKLKVALKRGTLDTAIAERYGGDENVDIINEDYKAAKFKRENAQSFADRVKSGDYKRTQNVTENYNGDPFVYAPANGEELRVLHHGESVLTNAATENLGRDNIRNAINGGDPFVNKVSNIIDSKTNFLKSLSVAPTNTAVSSAPSKLSFDPLSINLTGKVDMSSNGRTRSLNLDDYETKELKKLIIDAVTEKIGVLMRSARILTDKGYSGESDPYRGSYGGSR